MQPLLEQLNLFPVPSARGLRSGPRYDACSAPGPDLPIDYKFAQSRYGTPALGRDRLAGTAEPVRVARP
jgi:hypothetical protein